MIADMINNKKLNPIVTDCMFLSCHVRVSEASLAKWLSVRL